jgi:hypothetical protein
MLKSLILLIILVIFAGCQAKGGGTPGGGIIAGHVPVENKFTLTTPTNVTYIAGQTIPFTVTFPLDVTVTGSPKLTVTIGSTVVDANFVSVTGNVLLFEYLVVNGDSDLNGIAVASSVNLNGSTLTFNEGENCNTSISIPSLSSVKVSAIAGSAPVANSITPANFNEDASSTINLSYIDADGDLATSCAISSPVKVTVTTPCSCTAGVCSVGVTGVLNQNGSAGFGYTVTSLGQTSNTAAATFTLNPMPDAPVANSFSAPNFSEDAISTITLSYTDADGDSASTCSTSSLSNITVTTPCACSSGVCTVSVRGTANYFGPGGLSYTVTANGQVSNTAAVNFTINPVNDAPVTTNFSPAAFNEDTQRIINLSYTDTENNSATACSVTGETNVTETQACACAAGVCSVGVTGTANYFGSGAAFTFTVTAGGQVSNASVASLTINGIDDKPVGVVLTPPSFPENTQSLITLTYTDVESHLATTCSVTGETNITETQSCACAAGTCTVGVTGTLNYVGAASFNYTVTANGLTSDVKAANLTITNVDAAPVATNITPGPFAEDSVNTITLSYTDADSDQATTCSVTGEANVTESTPCSCSAGICSVGITGAANYNGAAGSFSYTVTANSAVSNTATATITYTAVDDKPVGNTLTPPDFVKNTQSIISLTYSDVESDLATTCALSNLNNVTITQACACAVGVCTVGVTGDLNYFGAAGFDYTVTANGLTSDAKSASFTITNTDTAPVATNVTPGPFAEDSVNTITLAYTDADSDQATTCSVTAETNLTETTSCSCAAGICTVGVTGAANYFGAAATFSYTVTANSAVSNTATATVTYTAVDDKPVGSPLTPPNFNKNTQSVINLSYSDVESDQATTCAISSLSNVTETQGCACAAGTCTVGVTGTLNYSGSAGFSYTVTANGLTSDPQTATFTIDNTDTAPVATNITPGPFAEDSVNTITLVYSDVDTDQATTCSVTGESNVTESTPCSCAAGVCTVGITGSANYFGGAASFTYTVTANSAVSNSATATITYTAVDDKPVGDTLTPPNFNKNAESMITLTYSDVESDQATTCAVSSLSNVTETQACACSAGTCTVGVTGTLNYFGAAGFSYTVTANGLTSDPKTATLTIDNSNTAPVATNINPGPFAEDSVNTVTLDYSDVDTDQATACSVTAETNLTETTACSCAAGVCTVGITGAANYFGTAGSFSYTVTANGQVSNTATASITYTSVDDAPVTAGFAAASFAKNSQSIITLPYTDIESDLAASCSVTLETNVTETQACACAAGTCTVGVTGTSNYAGAGDFTYTVTANSSASNASVVTFTITNTPPVANPISPTAFNEDMQSVITLNYSDVDSDQATLCSISGESNVTVSQACACSAGTCTVGVTGTTNTNGAASFNYTVTAGGQVSNSALATLSITAVDDKPTGIPLTPPAFNEDTPSTITLTYSDVEGDQATSCTATGATNITVTTPCTCALGVCTVGVTGTANYNGTASFNYTVTANGQASTSQPVSLTITGVDDAPTTANLATTTFNEDIQKIITLTYTAVGGDLATSCAITSPTNVIVTQACACASGTCTVGVTGTANYNGSASFQWTVSAGTAQSTSRNAPLTINPVDDAASLSAISAQSTSPNAATGAIAFTFNDPDGAVCSSARLSMSSTDTTLIPNANVVWGGTAPNCTATITPATDKTGTSTITITATDGGLSSKTVNFVLSVTGALVRWEYPLNTVITSYSFGSPGGNTSVTLKVKNFGNASGSVTMSDDNGSAQITSSSTCGTVAAGGTCDIIVNWSKSGPGGFKQTTFTATGPYNSAAVDVSGTK